MKTEPYKLYHPNLWEDQAMNNAKALPKFEDAQVQIVYETICETDENVPPNPEEHWEGWMARRIVAALTAPQALAATPAQRLANRPACSFPEMAATHAEDSNNALTGAALGRWCYENPNLAALTIEGLRAATPAVGGEDWREALKPLAALGLWQDKYPDGPDSISDQSLHRYFTPDEVRAARAALAQPEQPDHLVLDEFERLDGKFMQQIMLSDASELVREKRINAEEGDMS